MRTRKFQFSNEFIKLCKTDVNQTQLVHNKSNIYISIYIYMYKPFQNLKDLRLDFHFILPWSVFNFN